MSPVQPKILFGVAGIATLPGDVIKDILSILKKHNVKDLDTAYIYQNSEVSLNKFGLSPNPSYTIHSKAPGFVPGALGKQSVLDGLAETLKRLGTDHVETYFLHAPDTSTPIKETLAAISQLHSEGKFTHFGLSNFSVAQVQEIYDMQSSANAVLPSVYQGNYNAVARHIEQDLLPLLKKLSIAFYAYSPIAGGFLVKSAAAFSDGSIGTGRFSDAAKAVPVGQLYHGMYAKPALIAALADWDAIAQAEGISRAALAYRWIAWHSALKGPADGVIVGASSGAQLEESLTAIEGGPLGAETVRKIDELWEGIKGDAPLDNYHSSGR